MSRLRSATSSPAPSRIVPPLSFAANEMTDPAAAPPKASRSEMPPLAIPSSSSARVSTTTVGIALPDSTAPMSTAPPSTRGSPR